MKLYLLGVWTEILPVYLGARGFLLWPPVGLVALIVAVAAVWGTWRSIVAKGGTTPLPTTRLTKLAPLAIIWWVLVALSPMSSMPTWQGMRHHHSGLVCAWVLAFAGTGLVVSKLTEQRSGLRRVSGALVWLPALLLMTFLPTWGGLYAEKAIEIHHRHGVASGWLQEHAGESVLLLNDAGILSLAHDGPAIDVMGLGTPEFARAYRHGAGSLVEMLARRDPLPTVSAANLDVFRLRDVLSTAVIEGLAEDQTIVAEVDLPLLENTALEPPGIDFAHLPSEAAASLRWSPAPDPYLASLALKLPGEDGVLQLQGCRPLIRRLEVGISSGTTAVQATFAPVGDGESQLSLGFVGSDERHAATLPAGRWTVLEIEAPGDTHQMWLEALPGSVTPCLESLGFR